MEEPAIMEGTGEELEEVLRRMPKRRFRVILLPEDGANGEAAAPDAERTRPFYETASHEEWSRAFHEWIESHPKDGPSLPDEALTRESFYEGRA